MTKRLILLRHAKSAWDDLDMEDHERVLNARGRRSCAAMGPWLAERGYIPDEVLCSTSARTQETWALMRDALPGAPDPVLKRELYHAEAERLFDFLSAATGNTVAIVAHNPGIGYFASQIVTAQPAHPRFSAYPTLSTLIVDFPIESWSELKLHTGEVQDFIVPRELTD